MQIYVVIMKGIDLLLHIMYKKQRVFENFASFHPIIGEDITFTVQLGRTLEIIRSQSDCFY